MSRPYFEKLFDENFCENCAYGGETGFKENYCHHAEYQTGRSQRVPCSANTCPLLRDLVFKQLWPLTKKPG